MSNSRERSYAILLLPWVDRLLALPVAKIQQRRLGAGKLGLVDLLLLLARGIHLKLTVQTKLVGKVDGLLGVSEAADEVAGLLCESFGRVFEGCVSEGAGVGKD